MTFAQTETECVPIYSALQLEHQLTTSLHLKTANLEKSQINVFGYAHVGYTLDVHGACYFSIKRSLFSAHELSHIACVCKKWKRLVDSVHFGYQTLVLSDEKCNQHRIPQRSERPERVTTILRRLGKCFPSVQIVDSVIPASRAQVERFHTKMYINMLYQFHRKINASRQAIPVNTDFRYVTMDEDTVMMDGTMDACLAAAGAVCQAVDSVMNPLSSVRNAFCVVRPPGHHAEANAAMGFCFLNNVGIGAFHALDKYQLQRVLIIDFDVHHGNGIENRMKVEKRTLYISIHQHPLFPFTGTQSTPQCVNVTLPKNTNSYQYRKRILQSVVPQIQSFEPDLILLASGFDAHKNDPLAQICLQSQDYYWLTNQFTELAWQYCHGRIVSVLEGGYHLPSLADSSEEHVRALIHGSYPFLS
uniref:histone deacetylase n=1 Tax=Albugo laibachii Nc14 TaxID=890382 RepID=F0W7P9_9STRA|nr:histone deacetylase putative [Albugo laibachii Nc14]|eukprot:CCA17150.1 histone deacetylase putative [Albugo laibachii Nc14]